MNSTFLRQLITIDRNFVSFDFNSSVKMSNFEVQFSTRETRIIETKFMLVLYADFLDFVKYLI